jgi:hypothetical protein
MAWRVRAGKLGRIELMPACDRLGELFHQGFGSGQHVTAQTGYCRKRKRVDLRILPAVQQARHHAQLCLRQQPVDGKLPLKPFHPDSRTREQEHPLRIEQDQLVPPIHVQYQLIEVHAGERREPLRLRGHQHRVDRTSHEIAAHVRSMAAVGHMTAARGDRLAVWVHGLCWSTRAAGGGAGLPGWPGWCRVGGVIRVGVGVTGRGF